LAICKEIIERQNGKIWVESQEGQGASFHFMLPEYETTVVSEKGGKNAENSRKASHRNGG
jgi:signal transduction histidine kinase